MALITAQQITTYYNQFTDIDVTFTKEVVAVIHLRPKDVFVRALGFQWPCAIYSSSLSRAKIIVNIENDFSLRVKEANNLASLRFSFDQPDRPDPLAFFVSGKVAGYSEYTSDHPELKVVTLKYTQRPSDDLIMRLGALLDANINAKRRKEERIDINPETLRKLALVSKNAVLVIDNTAQKCIVRDLSFTGAMLILTGTAETLLEKDAKLKLAVTGDGPPIILGGKVKRFEEIPERKGIGSAGLEFNEKDIPMEYKLRLNEYLGSV